MRLFFTIVLIAIATEAAAEPLPSWSDTASKQAIVAFVQKVTKEGSSEFVPPAERIAVFEAWTRVPGMVGSSST